MNALKPWALVSGNSSVPGPARSRDCATPNTLVFCASPVQDNAGSGAGPPRCVFCGVRPSPGAATLGREVAIESSTALDNAELAVAEDGHTPLNGYPPRWRPSEARINRFAFQGQHAKDGFMHAPQRLLPNELLERFDAESELAECQRTFPGKATRPEPFEIFGRRVIRAVNDAEIFAAPAFDGGLNKSPATFRNEFQWFYHHAFAATSGQFLPPTDPC